MNTEMDLLKIAVQNAADKGICFGAPMDAGQVRAWESQHNVKLPEDYFSFLTEVGDGGTVMSISADDVCCKRCISSTSNTTYSQLICGIMK